MSYTQSLTRPLQSSALQAVHHKQVPLDACSDVDQQFTSLGNEMPKYYSFMLFL